MNDAVHQILIVYDNNSLKGDLIPAWGFSCLITLPPYQILFDSGGDPFRGLFEENVYLLIGGFHLIGKSPKELREITKKLDALKVERIAPCHCSGDTARDFFKQYYEDNYITCAAGVVIEIPQIEE